MADNRKYYYLKLKESYFDEDAIVLLESMQDGMLYSNILLKLYLKSLKNGGKLQLAENIPYTAQMIATITRQQVGTVEEALQIFMKCIANALMEKEVSVCMTNFALILNDHAASFKDRNECIARLCSVPLLILDDFGMERGTEYGLEQVYNVIDSRYRSGKPLIVTTNLTLEELQNPEDTAHARIYDRLTEMFYPVCITGENFRKTKAREKMERLRLLMNGAKK